jgi:uncharacterized protein (TIGR03435 family)
MLIRWPLAVLDAALVAPIVLAQTPSPPLTPGTDDMALGPAFEVATIRPGDRSDGRRWFGTRVDDSGHYMASGVSLDGLVARAYGRVDLDHEAPKWVSSEDFDINAKVDDAYMAGWDKMSDAQRIALVRPMVRRLLVDRFKLKLRTEVRDIPVYALVQVKGGTKMEEVPAPPPPEGRPTSVIHINCPGKEKEMTCMGKAVPMSQLIGLFAGFGNLQVGRTVIDETGLKGYYDYSFTVSTDADADAPIKQIEDQLGLRFEPRKVPRKVYVIESAEKPSLDGAEVHPQ